MLTRFLYANRNHFARKRYGFNYFGSTAWKIDFAVDSASSAAAVARSRTEGSAISARRSSGRESGISAGGVGRFGLAASMWGGRVGDGA